MSKIQTIILYLRLWQWAAMHSPDFSSMTIILRERIVSVETWRFASGFHFYGTFNRPVIDYWIPHTIVTRFSQVTGIDTSDIDGIPF